MAAAKDNYPGQSKAINAPSSVFATVTPSNADDLPGGLPKAIHNAGTAGTVACKDALGTSATFYMAQGATLAIRPRQILATGTTAGALVALY